MSGHSLIAVFHDLKIQIPGNAPDPPPNALLPKEWAIFVKYDLLPDEEGRDYAAQCDIFWPDGNAFVSHTADAAQPTKDGMSFIFRMMAFPIGQNGTIKAKVSLLSHGTVVSGPVEVLARVTVEKTLHATGAPV